MYFYNILIFSYEKSFFELDIFGFFGGGINLNHLLLL